MMFIDTSYSYTFSSYVALVGTGVACYYLYRNRRKASLPALKAPRAQPQQPQQQADGPREPKARKQRGEAYASEGRQAAPSAATAATAATAIKKAKNKAKNKKDKETAAESQRQANATSDSSDDGVDDKEFARQLSSMKEGKKLEMRSNNEAARQRSVKQSRASKVADFEEPKLSVPSAPSSPSSTTGAEADDDQSSAASPAVGPADNSGVADMLEPAPAGPSVLRLTDTLDSGKSKKTSKPAKEPPQIETKKQRQNRKKAEAAKAAREQAEKERKIGLEEHRRRVRIAEGRPAKDGSGSLAPANGTKNSWDDGAPHGSKSKPTAAAQPLDTFEPEKSEPAAVVESAPAPNTDGWMNTLPSEEEQLEMLKEESEWSTVKSKSSKRSMKKEKETQPASPSEEPPVEEVKPATQPSKPAKNGDGISEKWMGSFAALRSEDPPASLVEEEWDV